MKDEDDGALPNQPLFYVLASIRFEPWLLLTKHIDEIQNVLRDRFPVLNKLVFEHRGAVSAEGIPDLNAVTKQEAWSLMASDRSIGCQISNNQILVHGKRYTRFAQFVETVKFVLDAVQVYSGYFTASAIGLRYFDRIAPRAGEKFDDYLAPGFLSQHIESPNFTLVGGLSQATYKTAGGVLRAQFWTGEGVTRVPDEVVPLYIMTEELNPARFPIEALKKDEGTLDTDAIETIAPSARLQAHEIVDKLHALHNDIDVFFHLVCTRHAFDVWGEKS